YFYCCTVMALGQGEKIAPGERHSLLESVGQQGSVRVIVGLAVLSPTEQESTNQLNVQQAHTQAIQLSQSNVVAQLSTSSARLKHQFRHIPFMVYEIDEAALARLETLPQVVSIERDRLNKPSLAQSIPLIGADNIWSRSGSGAGKTIAILDSGVDNFHGFLEGKVVAEACYSTTRSANYSATLCPSGNDNEEGDGAGINCNISGCYHGTHVAGIAAGSGDTFGGVAKDANIIAIQVFSSIIDADYCSGQGPCLGAYDSDVLQGLERVYSLRDTFDIPAINLSLGGAAFSSQAQCDSANQSYLAAITNLTEAGIAVVAASGNSGYSNKVISPACVSGAISVGATNDSDTVAWFTNVAPFLSYMAPGVSIKSSLPDNRFGELQGTSMASPHVAGAIAALAGTDSAPDLTEILSALTNSAAIVNKNGSAYPRIQLDAALDLLSDNQQDTVPLNIKLSVDNSEKVFYNGVLLGGSQDWKQSTSYNVNVMQTNNVIAIKAIDLGGVGALLAQIEFDGQASYSDDNWKVSTVFAEGWQQTDFDDSHWQSASIYGFYGVTPWKLNVSGFSSNSQAQWIWSGDNLADNTVYFRYHLASSGAEPPLSIDTLTLPPTQVNQIYQVRLAATGGSPVYDWQIVSGQLPPGLELDKATGDISGIPLVSGNYTFNVQVKDSKGQIVSAALTLIVQADSNQSQGQMDINVSVDNAEQVYFNGQLLGVSDNWQQASQYNVELRAGLNVFAVKAQDVGGISGLIAVLKGQNWAIVSDGSWKVSTQNQEGWQQVEFDDQAWVAATQWGSYGVLPWKNRVAGIANDTQAKWIWSSDNEADDTVYFRYTVSVDVAPEPVVIVTEQPPAGQVNQPYIASFKASGGRTPYNWRLTTGTLPSGLSLNPDSGELSGTPNVAQTTNFSVGVEDSAGSSASAEFTLTIAPDPEQVVPTILDIVLSTDNVDEVYFNGVFMGTSSDWMQASHYAVELSAGENVVAVKATDIGGVAALIAVLQWADNVAYSDETWQVSITEQAGWQNIGFDASQWSTATIYGSYGIAPWKNRVVGLSDYTPANWIWSENNEAHDGVYFRFVITMP
ncbi:MAG: subtilisin family serine protease, partial [Paraglaciecola sp.]